MIRKEGALGFWLDWVEHNGGLWEDDGERAFAVLPETLAQDFELAEETAVTADPDVAREEGALLLITGHPLVTRAAESLLSAGDTGTVTLSPPRSVPPGAQLLLAKAREAFPVDHGRIDTRTDTPPLRALRRVLRVGALIGYEISTEEHFQEQAEVYLDLTTRLPLPQRTADRLAGTARDPGPAQEFDPSALEAALICAHQHIDKLATARRLILAAQSGNGLEQETARAREYYAAALDSLERRARTAPQDRRALLEARAQSTREEQARRLIEITEKFRARHEITPYRLHLLEVPVLRLEVDVSRGARRYPLTLEWLLPVGEFARLRCPTCTTDDPTLVATKTHLGCEHCVTTKAPPHGHGHQTRY
ncbi:hypothetical protein AB0G85_36550 [Streptomyces sioyaensis]|uniref:hypothetical protein n=1 Tax=Streptomyces sioyaensis TaxID=67364 RepID=UPI0033F9D41D